MKIFILLLCVFTLNTNNLLSQVFTPFTKLSTIKTEKFDIIFPEESRRTAEYIYAIIDDMYEENSKRLGSKVYGRITITITPDVNIFNAIAYPAPYPVIIIYDTPTSAEGFTTFDNNMYSVVLHELMHLLSLASENAGFQTRVFGTWASIGFLNTPMFMIEGAPVAYESLDGLGRANDPLVKQIIRQDIRDDNFKTSYQASLWSKYPYSIYYEYGGLFSKYLIDKYGMEKYNALWFKMQSKIHISLFSYRFGMYKFFIDVYGIEFQDAWNDFKQNMTILDIEDNIANKITTKETTIAATASFDDKLYYVDSSLAKLKVYNISDENKKVKTVMTIPQSTETIDISEDGNTILLSSRIIRNAFSEYIVREYSLKDKKYTKLKIEGVHSARYFRNGVIALSKSLHNSKLVYINEDGEEELLLPPSSNYSYSMPVRIDDNRIALIVVENGIKSIRILDYEKNTLSKIGTTLENNESIWKYVRSLNYSKNKVLFSFNDDDRFYKLGVLDINTGELHFYQTDYSGGVFNAVEIKDDIYYKAKFSEYEAIMKYPENDIFISSEMIITDMVELGSIENASLTFVPSDNIETSKYNGINYFKPWVAWIPLPLTNSSYPYFFNGIGLYTYLMSPTTEDTAIISLGYDIPSAFIQSSIDYTTLSLAYPLRIVFDNGVVYSSVKYWQTSAFISMTFYEDIFDDNNRISIAPVVSAVLFSEIRNINDPTSAFYWKYNSWSVNTAATLNYSYFVKGLRYLNDDVISLTIRPMYSIGREVFRVDSTLKLQSQLLPLRLSFYGAYSHNAFVDFDGTSSIFGGLALARGQDEFHNYVNNNKKLANWFVGGELELISAFSIEDNLGVIYFNELILSASYRGSYYYDEYLHSLRAKIGVKASIFNPAISAEPFITLALRLPNSEHSTQNYFKGNILDHFHIGFGLGASW